MKKVLAIAPYPYLPYFSGGQKFIAQFFEWLGKEVDLSVVSVAANDSSLAKNYRLIPLLKGSFSRYYDHSLTRSITELVKKEGFDTVIWEHPYYAWLAFRVRKRTGVRTIIHTHNIEYQRFRSTGRWWWPFLKTYEKKAFKKADALFFITPEDKNFAVNEWKIAKEKCVDLPFGIEIMNYPEDKASCARLVRQQYDIGPGEKIILFSGLLNYKPNLDALKIILDKINPLLQAELSFRYKIIICGKGLPGEFHSLKEYADKNIIYAGFIADIETYTKAADIFLNPVQAGGGIKTKMVEAIACGTTVISTESGATGIAKEVCGDKLVTVPDNDWAAFSGAVMDHSTHQSITPQAYYDHYYWGNVIKKIKSV
ncbi:MAG: glycosyltransferase family 4 protein [Chitinophagaceae bacterium]